MSYPVTAEVMFDGDRLMTIREADIDYVAMKPIVEAIGLDWKGQHAKLTAQQEKFNYGDITIVAADGKLRMMGCIPIKKLNGWLFGINPSKVKSSIRDKLIAYQEECFAALHDYWTKGVALNLRRMTIMDRINDACANYKFDKGIASSHGKGLREWQDVKPEHIRHINGLVTEAIGMLDMVLADTGRGKLTRT